MPIASAQPLSEVRERLSVRPMQGPFANIAAACDGCDRQVGTGRYHALAATGKELAVLVDKQWWSIELMINDTCSQTYDAPIVRDLLTNAPGDEVFVRVTAECPQSPEPFADPEPERSEHIVICGVGPAKQPSCVEVPFGITSYLPNYSQHVRLDLACDGDATFTSWEGTDPGYSYLRTRQKLVLR
jgi:hypothetical protein